MDCFLNYHSIEKINNALQIARDKHSWKDKTLSEAICNLTEEVGEVAQMFNKKPFNWSTLIEHELFDVIVVALRTLNLNAIHTIEEWNNSNSPHSQSDLNADMSQNTSKKHLQCTEELLMEDTKTEQNTSKSAYKSILEYPIIVSILRNAERRIEDKQENSFPLIARLWSDYLGHSISEKDVAILMVLLKIARIKLNIDTQDSHVDACSYLALAFNNEKE